LLEPVAASMEVQAPLGSGERWYWQWLQMAEVLTMLEVLAKAEVIEKWASNMYDVGAQCTQPVVLIDVLAPMPGMEVWVMAVEMMEILALSTVEMATADDNREKEEPKPK